MGYKGPAIEGSQQFLNWNSQIPKFNNSTHRELTSMYIK